MEGITHVHGSCHLGKSLPSILAALGGDGNLLGGLTRLGAWRAWWTILLYCMLPSHMTLGMCENKKYFRKLCRVPIWNDYSFLSN